MAGALINVPKEIKRGETFEIKTLVRHPMETGYRRGPSGEAIARDIITRFVCTYDGEEIFRAELFPAVAANPFIAFKERFAADLGWLMGAEMGRFHAYSFATLRQYGACFELAETHLRWLAENGIEGLVPSADALREIAQTAKNVQFQLARAMARRKPLDLSPLDAMGAAWERAMEPLRNRF